MEVRKASLPDGDNPYSTPNCSSRRSVINMCPGAWVIMRSGFTSIATAWGVTPQAQKTGTSPSRIVKRVPEVGTAQITDPDRLRVSDLHRRPVDRREAGGHLDGPDHLFRNGTHADHHRSL